MTEPQLDPITGLPADISTSSIFSIPLNSRPALAPQWQPQGSEPPGVYPDRIPSVFATMQAQNQDNPGTVNALRTHTGTQALEVYQVNSSGGGSFSGIAPYLMGGDWDYHFIGASSGFTRAGGIGTNQYLYSFDLSWFVDPSNATWPVTGLLSAGFVNNSDQEMPVIVIGIYADAATGGSPKAGRESRVFLPSADLANSGIETGGSGYQICVRNETTGDLNYNINVILSST